MIYEAEKGYGLQFTLFSEQYDVDDIIYRETKEEIIRLADVIMCSFGKSGLMAELNDMQANSYTYNEDGTPVMSEVFKNKFEIPSYFINLFLEKYNMRVLGW